MISSILAPTDFSPASLAALQFAAALAKSSGAKLHLLHVIDPLFLLSTPRGLLPFGSVEKEVTNTLTTQLEAVAADLSRVGVVPSTRVAIGRVTDEINHAATQMGADLIVVATHGHTALKYAFLGSTAERLVKQPTCPVLVFRPKQGASHQQTDGFGRILVPVDFSEPSRAGVEYALPFARKFGAYVVLFHAVEVHRYFLFGGHEAGAAPAQIQQEATTEMGKLRKAALEEGYEVDTKIAIGSPVQQIEEYVASQDIDLIITSTHGRSGLSRLLIGNTAERLVRYVSCSVLVVENRETAAEN